MDWTQDCAFDATRKRRFNSTALARLRLLTAELRLAPGSYDLRTNKAGPAVSGEITLHHDCVYVQVSQRSLGPDAGILIHTCRGRRDYADGQNHFAPPALLDDVPRLAAVVRRIAPALRAREARERERAALRFVTGQEVRERGSRPARRGEPRWPSQTLSSRFPSRATFPSTSSC